MTQKQAILTALKRRQRLTPLDALRRFGCFRLAARIADLRADGLNIVTSIKNGHAVYSLKPPAPR